MSSTTYTLTNRDGNVSLSVFADSFEKVLTAEHPMFQQALQYLTSTDPSQIDEEHLRGLVDPTIGIGRVLAEHFGDRLTFDLHNLYLDGVRFHGALATTVKQRMLAGDQDWLRFAKFLVNLDANPSHNAQQALWTWVDKHGLTVTEDGRFLGYKAVRNDGLSSSSGPNNFVNGVLLNDGAYCQVPHEIGSVISKRRADVDDTPGGGCSVGLHVGTYEYAKNFAPRLLTVAVNPRDVVSASDSDLEVKIRVCEYEVISMADPVQFERPSYDLGMVEDDEEGTWEDEVEAYAAEAAEAEEQAPKTKVLDDWAQENDDLRSDLLDTHLGHKPLARKWANLTTESSVRRWRKNHGVKVSLGARLQG